MVILAVVLLLGGCGPSQAELYREALAATELDEALRMCAALEVGGGDCANAAVERMGRWDACDRVPDSGECHFLHADAMGIGGDIEGGLAECRSAMPYADECNLHLVGLLAMQGDTVAEADTNFARVAPLLKMKRARSYFFRQWFRSRQERGLPVSGDGCPDEVCVRAAEHVSQEPPPPGRPQNWTPVSRDPASSIE